MIRGQTISESVGLPSSAAFQPPNSAAIAQARNTYSMAYVMFPHGIELVKEAHETRESNLADITRQAYEMGGSEKVEQARRENIAINTLMGWDKNFHESGKYDCLADWLIDNG